MKDTPECIMRDHEDREEREDQEEKPRKRVKTFIEKLAGMTLYQVVCEMMGAGYFSTTDRDAGARNAEKIRKAARKGNLHWDRKSISGTDPQFTIFPG